MNTEKPHLIYDDECAFCKLWVEKWQKDSNNKVAFSPYQAVAALYPHISKEDFAHAVKLIGVDGQVYSGAEAVYTLYSVYHPYNPFSWMYTKVKPFARFSEAVYTWVAKNRSKLYKPAAVLLNKDKECNCKI
ncbi:MAG: thiol-disulfide oxidoreductase DCC family protein [Patescibacteria group bacterium]